MNIKKFKEKIENNCFKEMFIKLYGSDERALQAQNERYISALDEFSKLYPEREDVSIYSASGRSEIGGNHTDHQGGVVLAGAVNLDNIGVVSFHEEGIVRVKSEGYEQFSVFLENLSSDKEDSGAANLVKGVIFAYAQKGVNVKGFDMYCTSDVLAGGGISSSAAFEILICTVIENYYNENRSMPFEIAKIGQFSENVFLKKSCGLMDQTASAYGGLVSIDFKDENNPVVEKIEFDFEEYGYALCITDTKKNHENLTPDFAAIRSEMGEVSKYFNKETLSEVSEEEFYDKLYDIRKKCSDRAVLRAMHYFSDTKRAALEAKALKAKDVDAFLKLVNESGESSSFLLQNLYSAGDPLSQEIPLAIAVSKKVLKGKGAVRVHGGGFAGTIQAFVPLSMLDEYTYEMEKLFGKNACFKVNIRQLGGVEIKQV